MTIYIRTPFIDRHRRIDDALQLAIAILSPAAILLMSEPGPLVRWGFVVGLLSQPFWMIASFRAKQFGMLAMSLVYLAVWIRGIALYFPGLFA